jgi:hypothetical protein
MKDIFLSYKKLDVDRVRVLVDAFERSGFTVWWDRTIPPGKSWAQVIEEAITTCHCVVVVWSQNSVDAEWVHKEARKGEQRGNLLPVMIDAVQPPFEFEHVQAASLIGWDGVSAGDQYEQLVERIEAVIKAQPEAGEEAVEEAHARKEGRHRSQVVRRAIAAAAIAISFVVAAAALFVPSRSVEIELTDLKLSGVRFRLSPEERGGSASALVLQEIPIQELVAFGLAAVHIPAGAGGSGGSFSDDPVIELVALGDASTIDLTGLELPAGAVLEMQETRPGHQLIVRGATEELGLSLSGLVLVAVEDVDTLDFAVPGRVGMRPDPDGFTVEFLPAAASLTLFDNLAVDDLRLYRVDQDVGLDETSVDLVSTIHGGRLSAGWMGERELVAGEELRFDSFDGSILRLELVGDTIVLNARGQSVTGLRTGLTGDGESLMPTLLGSMGMPGKSLSALAALLYVTGLVLLTRRLWRRTI